MFSKTGMPDLPRAILHQKADDIELQIQELATLRDTLRHIADCSAPSHMECPTFRRLMDEAMVRNGAEGTRGSRGRIRSSRN